MGSLLENLRGGRTAKPTSRGKAAGKSGSRKAGAKSYVKKKAAKGKGPKRP